MTAPDSDTPITYQVPEIAGNSEPSGEERVEAVGGNVGNIWRAWWFWTPGNGTFNLRLDWNVIGRDSTVVVTASEVNSNRVRFVGAAPFQVSSIAPDNGFVTFKISIGWGSPLPMRTDLLVFN